MRRRMRATMRRTSNGTYLRISSRIASRFPGRWFGPRLPGASHAQRGVALLPYLEHVRRRHCAPDVVARRAVDLTQEVRDHLAVGHERRDLVSPVQRFSQRRPAPRCDFEAALAIAVALLAVLHCEAYAFT